jgi:hypothetical protein
MMSDEIAVGAAPFADLEEELVREAGNRRPDGERHTERKERTHDRAPSARPGELYKAGMFGLLAAVQLAWFAAIGYVIFAVVR